MNLSEDLNWRGLIKDKSFTDQRWIDEPKTLYLGVDATADSLTIGNLALLLLGRRFLDAGWKTVILVGGATTLIGDPGGKDKERPLQPREEVLKNLDSVRKQINHLFGGKQFTLVDNYDWFAEVKYLDFLRDVGKHFSMTELMQRDFVNERMGEHGSGISYAEFSYSLIQGYDYLQLYQKHGTVLQIGGSDQWGNMLSGVSLVRKKEGKEVQALSMPLVVDKSTGRKFGKTEAGAVWLDSGKTPPEQFYQLWINATDEDALDYLKIFTLLSKQEIESVISEHLKEPSKRIAQKRLAEELTKTVHGEAAAGQALDIAEASTGTSKDAKVDDKVYVKLASGTSLIDALVHTKLAASNTEARRFVEEGAVYINNEPAKEQTLEAEKYENGRLVLRRGKKYQNSTFIELN